MELIDKEALMARIHSEGKHQAAQNANRYDPVVLAFGDCYSMAKTAPVVDAVEVRHGEWTVGYFQDLVCTACTHPSPCDKKTPYCPNCGAKMDGHKKDVM